MPGSQVRPALHSPPDLDGVSTPGGEAARFCGEKSIVAASYWPSTTCRPFLGFILVQMRLCLNSGALLFRVTIPKARRRRTSVVCASLWLRVMLSKAAPFLGRKMLFGVGKGCLEFPPYSSSRLSRDVSAVWDHLPPSAVASSGGLIPESWESVAPERDPRGLRPSNSSCSD